MKNFKSPTNRLQRVEDESELEEIKRRLFGDGTTRVESKSKKLQRRCQCAFVDTYPHDHFRISFSEQSLGLKFREGCIVALRKNTGSKYDVREGDFIHMVNDKNINLFRDAKEELQVDRRILKYFMQFQERPLEIEFIRFQRPDHHPKVVKNVVNTTSPVVVKTRPKRSWSQTKNLRRRASSEDRFQIRKSELLEEARSYRTKWIKSEWEDVVSKVSRRQRHGRVDLKEKTNEKVEERSALDIMESLVKALGSNEDTLAADESDLDVQHLEDLMNASLNLLDSIASPELKNVEKEEKRKLDEDEIWFLDLIKQDAAASIVASAQRFITTAIAEMRFTTTGMNTDMGRLKSFSDISSSVLNLDEDDLGDDEKKAKAVETKTEHVAEKIRKFTKYLQRRIYAVAVEISGGEEEKKKWSQERKTFVCSVL